MSREARRGATVSARRLGIPDYLVGPAVFFVDLCLLVGASLASAVGYHRTMLQEVGDLTTFIGLACAVAFYLSILLAYRGNYSVRRLMQPAYQCRAVTMAWIAVFLMLVTLAFLLKVGPNLSRGATIAFFLTGWIALVGWRALLGAQLRHARALRVIAPRQVVVVSDRAVEEARVHLQDLACHDYEVAQFRIIPASDDFDGFARELIDVARPEHRIDSFFLLMDWGRPDQIDRLAEILRAVPLPVRLFPDPKVSRFLGQHELSVGGVWATEIQRAPLSLEERLAKRALDIAVSAVLLLAASPLMLASALLVKLGSRGPVLFTQARTGFSGVPFRIFKFRTLTTMDDGRVVKQVSRNDDRLTPVGRWLRRTSIDELPQLINILRGEMSLVGPRPHAAAHTDYYGQLIANYAYRHHVKPGLTGWAQVNGFRGETTLSQMKARVDHDLWYIDNWSLWLDVKILLKTCVVLLRSPAY
ncbi:exopolysaccharide biosynthesis polyprenyl glycosylphosphotransferase [Bradyrhizobium sp. BR 10261]|uniref:exopolysaccharide biosynthesis polyprenyl glycosylphosphotransferase n=1 Tax=Bradyrhizobium sp. BR 10261 TaxID=2749992 RepID=UPI001C64981D|nr:exopolysaccharide biosynthesis polyprenyl glycosylphosphotransferase [Bradyrhizobium sp. BR 10261]MBW7961819.1 exopolysaccharide biosynthesis polyprenyl glycosylphosphotransferase [Bradyrhizobium sp. BR 10261]